MRFAIRWEPTALRDLAEQWEASEHPLRVAITDALNDLERLLTTRAYEMGESREDEGVRWVSVEPVILTCRVDLRLREVLVVQARAYRRR